MFRVIRWSHPGSHGYVPVQIWTPPDHPVGVVPAQVTVEWRSAQYGHPTSYALLGGHVTDGNARLDVSEDGARFRLSKSGPESARYGLDGQYRATVLEALPKGIAITVAAHDDFGSSILAFRIVGRLLAHFLTVGIPVLDDEVLELERAIRVDVRATQRVRLT